MKDVTSAKGLNDLRTATTHHITAKPPRKGTTYLDLFALSMECQRLEQELVGIERRQKRILSRLADARSAMEKLVYEAQLEKAAESSSAKPIAAIQAEAREQSGERQWKKMTVNY